MKIISRLSISADGYVTTPDGWPALNTDRWPWPNLDVFILGSRRAPGTPDHVVTDSDPQRLLEAVRAANRGGDDHSRSPAELGGDAGRRVHRLLGVLEISSRFWSRQPARSLWKARLVSVRRPSCSAAAATSRGWRCPKLSAEYPARRPHPERGGPAPRAHPHRPAISDRGNYRTVAAETGGGR